MNEDKATGVLDQVKGSVKQAFGEATNNQSLANEGAADQVKGHAKEAWGSVKDTASNLNHSRDAEDAKLHTEQNAHSFRDSVTNAAESAKESIQRGLHNLEHKAND
ncbi:CsbD family protein [Granulicella tundricola]|uniref:CsbD family protein n=1 Tax=Granulicella tundricola (strain ATCC BAA-1859 / DSM 23138 / MP5ACTX9) TaxID=1198114 RepID=E8WWK0_GRATM|nr:CsbD family protein [Granulicella tundricola]ADW69664.1 CsbD family protein [Granulicella tundricola MP5ACTX9]